MAKADAQMQSAGGATGGITGGYAPPATGQSGFGGGPSPQILQALLSRFSGQLGGGQMNQGMPQGRPFQPMFNPISPGMINRAAMPQQGMMRPAVMPQTMNPAGSNSPLNPSDQSGMLNNFMNRRKQMQQQDQ